MSAEKNLIADFEIFNTWEERYEYIIDMGKALPSMEKSLKTEYTKIDGCMSQVWVHISENNNNITLQADSDAIIVKGLLGIILYLYNNKTKEEINAIQIHDTFKQIGLDKNLAGSRRNGLNNIIHYIHRYCQT